MCDTKQTNNQIDKMPSQLANEMQMPARIMNRLQQSMKFAQEVKNAKSLESRIRSAEDAKSMNMVNKIVKAQAHNQKVMATMNQRQQLLNA